jgi:hypothetical protein
MPIDAGKLRVLIPTTAGPVEVLLLTEEDPTIGRSVACIGGTTETADIAGAYQAFVARPTGIIERLFGHCCYRLDVSGRIDAGSSWQLGVLAAHALHAAGRLAQERDTADGVLWATGSVRPVDLTVGEVSHVSEKLAHSIDRLEREASPGRAVLMAIPAQNTVALAGDVRGTLEARGIEVITPADVRSLLSRLGVELPAMPKSTAHPLVASAGSRRVIGAAAVFLGVVLGIGALYPFLRGSSPPAEPSIQAEERPARKEAELLVPETVPFASNRDRAAIRAAYLPAPDFKALALSSHTLGFTTDQPDEVTARNGAMAACQRAMEAQHVRSQCEIYAVGPRIVSNRGRPPMPPLPWIVANSGVETPFSAKDVPLVTESRRHAIEAEYAVGRKPKALALSATGFFNDYHSQSNTDEAVRRALERCGSNSGTACMIIALDDQFIVPIPKSMRVVGIFQPNTMNAIAPELRDEVSRRLGNATNGWNALAVGASGNVGVKLGAKTEQDAVGGAMEDCTAHDRACRVLAIGPFLVDGGPSAMSKPLKAPKSAELIAALTLAAPTLTVAAREDLADKYEALKEHKALAVVPGTSLNFRTAEWATPAAAEEGVLERCQAFHGNPCALVAVDDRLQVTAPALGRDMERVRYVGTFDPDRIPGIFPAVRLRPDIVRYQNVQGPKAAAYHPWGRVFIVLSAESQSAAEAEALAKCNADPTRQGQDGPCHLYAIGDKVVLPQRLTTPITR